MSDQALAENLADRFEDTGDDVTLLGTGKSVPHAEPENDQPTEGRIAAHDHATEAKT